MCWGGDLPVMTLVTRSIKISLGLSLIVHSVIGVTFCLVQTSHVPPPALSEPVLTIHLNQDPTAAEPPAAGSTVRPEPPPQVAMVEAVPEPPTAPKPEALPPALPVVPEPVATKPVVPVSAPVETPPPPPTTTPGPPQIRITAEPDTRPPAASGFSSSTNANPDVLAHPAYRKNPEPVYPVAARRRRQEGMVLLAVTVTSQGKAGRVELRQTSGFPLLDEAALQTVREWDFEPARRGNNPVESRIEVPVRYQLSQ